MAAKDEKLQTLTEIMHDKYRAWRRVADQLNAQNAEGIAPTGDDINAYNESDEEYMVAKRQWENRLKELYQN